MAMCVVLCCSLQCENVRRLYQQLATAVEACTLPTTTTTCSPGTPSTRQMQAHVHHASHDADALDWAVALEPLPPLPQREAVQVRVPAHVGGDAASGSGRRCPRTALQQSSAPQHGACGPHTKAPSHVSAQPQTIPRKVRELIITKHGFLEISSSTKSRPRAAEQTKV